jgi:hypothetical protein
VSYVLAVITMLIDQNSLQVSTVPLVVVCSGSDSYKQMGGAEATSEAGVAAAQVDSGDRPA